MKLTLRSLYICYLSLEDPLVHTQVVAYLEGLARAGHTTHLLTFDPDLSFERRRDFREDMKRRGITWHSLQYHKRPSLPATIYDVFAGTVMAVRIVRASNLDAIHARNHVPAAMGLTARRLTGCALIFDIRGLMAEQYVDAGDWRPGGIAVRITHRIQDAAIRRADSIVMLTEAVRRHLFGPEPDKKTHVIPCCADIDRLALGAAKQRYIRETLDLEGRPILVYAGKLSGRYMTREMVDFFAVARGLQPSLLFLILTQDSPDIAEAEFERAEIANAHYRVTRAEPEDVADYLATGQFGIFLYRSGASDLAVSPTKIGEYLGAGLPVVSGPGVGDTDALLLHNKVGVVIDDCSLDGYQAAARQMLELSSDRACRERCRTVARENLSLEEVGLPRYDKVYRQVAEAIKVGTDSTP